MLRGFVGGKTEHGICYVIVGFVEEEVGLGGGGALHIQWESCERLRSLL